MYGVCSDAGRLWATPELELPAILDHDTTGRCDAYASMGEMCRQSLFITASWLVDLRAEMLIAVLVSLSDVG